MTNTSSYPPTLEGADANQGAATAPLRPVERLGQWVIWLCSGMIIVEVIYGAGAIYSYDFVTTWKTSAVDYRGTPWDAAATTFDGLMGLLGTSYTLSYFVMGVTYLVWVYRTSFNARLFDPDPQRITPGWAVGWYFVPILLYWKPYIAVREIWHSSHGTPGAVTAPTPRLIGWWWLSSVVTGLLSTVIFRTSLEAEFEDLDGLATLEIVVAPIAILALFLTIRIVRSITQAQVLGPAARMEKVFE